MNWELQYLLSSAKTESSALLSARAIISPFLDLTSKSSLKGPLKGPMMNLKLWGVAGSVKYSHPAGKTRRYLGLVIILFSSNKNYWVGGESQKKEI